MKVRMLLLFTQVIAMFIHVLEVFMAVYDG